MSQARPGLFGCAALAVSFVLPAAALAQETGRSVSTPCSGFSCLLPTTGAAAAAKTPQAAPVAATEPDEPDPRRAAVPRGPQRAAAKPRPVSIAAEPADAARLRTLAAALPKGSVRFVDPRETDADLRVTAAPRRAAEHVDLYTADLHVVAGQAIAAIGDLQGKVVSFGPADGPTRSAARKAFAALGIDVKETALDIDNALDGLATGDIDAVVVLAPQPVGALAALHAPALHLVAWPEGAKPPEGAALGAIAQAAYPGLSRSGEAVPAIGIPVVLQMDSKPARQTAARQTAARAVLAALAQHSAGLGGGASSAARDGQHMASAEKR